MNKGITRKLEEYLEAIYEIKKKYGKKVVRVKEVAEYMNVSMPSVTDAMNRLSKLGLVDYEKRGYLDLTENGRKIAEDLHKREELIAKFFTEFLLLEPSIARENACKLEHELTPKIVKRLGIFVEFIEKCLDKESIKEAFSRFLKNEKCE